MKKNLVGIHCKDLQVLVLDRMAMPLIDGLEVKISQEITERYANEFTTSAGMLLDKAGLAWMRWRVDGLEAWWNFFEECIDVPMGRRLANAACDEEEWLISSGQLDVSGFFKNRKSVTTINSRWELFGWGQPLISPPGVESGVLTPIVCGFLQADLERKNNCRYRMRWEQKSSEHCRLNLENSTSPIVPAPPPPKSESYQLGLPTSLQIENKWCLEGKRHCLLPAGLFSRLEDACAGFTANISEDERAAWPERGDGFLAMALASFRLFVAGEELFMAADAAGWKDSVSVLFGERGLGSPSKVEFVDNHGGVELHFDWLPFLPISVGMIAAAWTRCEGRPVKVELSVNNSEITVRLSSRYELA